MADDQRTSHRPSHQLLCKHCLRNAMDCLSSDFLALNWLKLHGRFKPTRSLECPLFGWYGGTLCFALLTAPDSVDVDDWLPRWLAPEMPSWSTSWTDFVPISDPSATIFTKHALSKAIKSTWLVCNTGTPKHKVDKKIIKEAQTLQNYPKHEIIFLKKHSNIIFVNWILMFCFDCILCTGFEFCVLTSSFVYWLRVLCTGIEFCVLASCSVYWLRVLCTEIEFCVLESSFVYRLRVLCIEFCVLHFWATVVLTHALNSLRGWVGTKFAFWDLLNASWFPCRNWLKININTKSLVKPSLHEHVFLDKFVLARKTCSCRWRKITNFSLTRKSWHASFSLKRKFVKAEICSCKW
jgi:hypothetical protein